MREEGEGHFLIFCRKPLGLWKIVLSIHISVVGDILHFFTIGPFSPKDFSSCLTLNRPRYLTCWRNHKSFNYIKPSSKCVFEEFSFRLNTFCIPIIITIFKSGVAKRLSKYLMVLIIVTAMKENTTDLQMLSGTKKIK